MILPLLLLVPPTEPGVWLDAPPKPGTVITAPLDLRGETQALEGVLRVDLYEVRGDTSTLVTSYTPAVPVGTVRFAFRWDPGAPGTVTLRVVATTLVRGFSAEAPGLVVPSPARLVVLARPAAPITRAAATWAAVTRPFPSRPSLDDTGRAFGAAAPVLPYALLPPTPSTPSRPIAAIASASTDRSGWTSVAAGFLLLLVSAHLHLVLRRDLP